MEQTQIFLFIVYLLDQRGRELEVRCRGCREIIVPDYKTPTHIRGMIEFDGVLIPIIDPGVFFHKKPVQVTNSTCILVVEYYHESRNRRIGILMEDTEEILNLAAGSYRTGSFKPSTFNMRFVVKMSGNAAMTGLLVDTHTAFRFSEEHKQAKDHLQYVT